MLKKLALLLLTFAGAASAGCLTLTVPTDYLTIDAWRRADQAANWTATKTAHNDCKDSLNNGPLTRIVNWTSNLQMRSLQDLALRIDSDNNGTNKLVFLGGAADTLAKFTEDTTARFYRHMTVDSTLTVRKIVVLDSMRLNGPILLSGRVSLTDSLIGVGMRLTGNMAAVNGTYSGTLGVTGNLTLTTLTAGRIPYASTAGLIAQDNLYWDATNDRLGIGSGASSPTYDLEIGKTTIGAQVIATIYNHDNTNGASHATLGLFTGGASGGDPKVSFSTNVTDWSLGIDNSVSGDPFVLSANGSLGTSNVLSITTAGAATFPSTITADSIISDKLYHEGTFTGTLNGCTTSPTGTFSYIRVGKQVTLKIPEISGTSNTTAMSITGVPASIRPSTSVFLSPHKGANCQDNGSYYATCGMVLNASGTIDFLNGVTYSFTFTNSGTKGTAGPFTASGPGGTPILQSFTYTLQ